MSLLRVCQRYPIFPRAARRCVTFDAVAPVVFDVFVSPENIDDGHPLVRHLADSVQQIEDVVERFVVGQRIHSRYQRADVPRSVGLVAERVFHRVDGGDFSVGVVSVMVDVAPGVHLFVSHCLASLV